MAVMLLKELRHVRTVFFLEGLVMTHFSFIVQEWEWHLYPGWTTGCCRVFVYCKNKDGKGCSTRNRVKTKVSIMVLWMPTKLSSNLSWLQRNLTLIW